MNSFVNYWLPVFVWMAIIFSFSAVPSLSTHFPVELLNTLTRKFAHIGEYALFALLLARAFRHSYSNLQLQQILQLSFTVAILYGISDEYHQLFVVGREGTFRDLMFDAIGIALVCLYMSIKEKKGR